MASQIQIKVGNLTSAVNSSNDQKIGTIIGNYALAMGFDPAATPQQKLNFTTKHLVDYMAQVAKDYQVGVELQASRDQADQDFDWEENPDPAP